MVGATEALTHVTAKLKHDLKIAVFHLTSLWGTKSQKLCPKQGKNVSNNRLPVSPRCLHFLIGILAIYC